MLFINRLIMIGLLSVGIAAATTAQAGNQMFTAEWHVFAFGNECVKDKTGQPECVQPPGDRTGPSEFFGGFGIPFGPQCNADWPRCPFQSTPTDGGGDFNALGGPLTANGDVRPTAYCTPWNQPRWGSKTMRPAKGGTVMSGYQATPPLYRNYRFFQLTQRAAQHYPMQLGQHDVGRPGRGAKGRAGHRYMDRQGVDRWWFHFRCGSADCQHRPAGRARHPLDGLQRDTLGDARGGVRASG